MSKVLTFLYKNIIYLVVIIGYVVWCLIVTDFLNTDLHISFKLLILGLGIFGWYLSYIVLRKVINRREDDSSED